ncbi:MAG: hypothetical protein LBC31_04150 [Treponema sp.]|jgi:hypothetical protein|nr:hypothetical protein [Treponema sp.]
MAKQDRYTAHLAVFFLYGAAAFIAVCGYRFLFSSPAPLAYFTVPWYVFNGIITFIHLFPAVAFSALVIPFGLKEHSAGGYAGATFVGNKGFSPLFLKYLTWPVITASAAAVLYGVLFFLVLPLSQGALLSMQNRAELYNQAKAKAESKAADKNWAEASQFIALCERIWPGGEEIEKLKAGITNELSAYRQSLAESRRAAEPPALEEVPVWLGIPGDPVNAADALQLAEEAFSRERYYDAHWLATLAQRLARPGNAEISAAAALASRAWEKIAALEPNAQEKERYTLYRMKRDGYEAKVAGDWISAFYIFQELAVLTPDDPDVAKYLEESKNGITQVAFFIDELDLAIGNILAGPVFSLPGQEGGRIVLRFASLASLPDYSYAWGGEALAADPQGNLRFRVSTDYAKLIPVIAMDGEGNSVKRVALLLRTLDRTNREQQWEPVWTEGDPDPASGSSQIVLGVDYDDFLLLSKMKRGTEGLTLQELFTAEKSFDGYGYAGEAFKAEILRRLADPVFFLPMAVLAMILGWRYRTQKKPRYVYVPMLGILPLVFYGAVMLYRHVLDSLVVWLSLYSSLSGAMLCLTAGAAVCFILTLVLLAAQHG